MEHQQWKSNYVFASLSLPFSMKLDLLIVEFIQLYHVNRIRNKYISQEVNQTKFCWKIPDLQNIQFFLTIS